MTPGICWQVLRNDIRATLPPDPNAEAAPKASSKPAKTDERPEEMVPELVKFLKAHPELKAVSKAVQVRSQPEVVCK